MIQTLPKSNFLSNAMSKEIKRENLVNLLRNITPEMKRKLRELKRDRHEIKSNDFIWRSLLASIATLGNERGYQGLIANEENYCRITFEALSKIPTKKRLKHIERVLRDAKVRMPAQKSRWLNKNYELVVARGGVEKVSEIALSLKGADAKIRFLKTFQGIGDKYARNIWMDVFHKDFRDSMAIDLRINQITQALGYKFKTYEEHERFYQEIAREAGLLTWEVDRLLYNYKDFFLAGIADR
jgi:hypothetical protein